MNKNAFSLLEIILSIIILSIVFISLSKLFFYFHRNEKKLDIFQKLYTLQNELYLNPKQKDIILHTQELKDLKFKEHYIENDLFKFKRLYIQDQNYTYYFLP
ncbi:hypothetical protein H2278_01750 [Campylobacter sp. W0018]|uniref:hypothetical protein n=1 Tax=Campylobacter TaxID=194 RepID=UPI00301B8FD1|nr:hypothetical protein [Campylobacter sp. W0018]